MQGMGWLTTEELVFDAQGRLSTHAPVDLQDPDRLRRAGRFSRRAVAVARQPRADHLSLEGGRRAAADAGDLGLLRRSPTRSAASGPVGIRRSTRRRRPRRSCAPSMPCGARDEDLALDRRARSRPRPLRHGHGRRSRGSAPREPVPALVVEGGRLSRHDRRRRARMAGARRGADRARRPGAGRPHRQRRPGSRSRPMLRRPGTAAGRSLRARRPARHRGMARRRSGRGASPPSSRWETKNWNVRPQPGASSGSLPSNIVMAGSSNTLRAGLARCWICSAPAMSGALWCWRWRRCPSRSRGSTPRPEAFPGAVPGNATARLSPRPGAGA